MSDILKETKESYDDVKRTIESIRSDAVINSIQDDILNELNDKFDNRKNVFAVSSVTKHFLIHNFNIVFYSNGQLNWLASKHGIDQWHWAQDVEIYLSGCFKAYLIHFL